MKRRLTRRNFMQLATGVTAAVSLESLIGSRAFASPQFGSPQPVSGSPFALVTTVESAPWMTGTVNKPTFSWELLNLNVGDAELSAAAAQAYSMQGFGACFNELGWVALRKLSDSDRQAVLRELFDPSVGARFTYCRVPIGANDFATEPYTSDEVDGDFDLKHFSIDHDRQSLISFIQAAQKYQPQLRLWASPWTPPSWMKRNHFYAEAKAIFPGQKDNGIRPDQIGHEGEDMFILEPNYLDAYARYFGRFIDEYRKEGIPVGMVAPQNEFNSAQNFPSCTWTPQGLAKFIKRLGPEMAKRNVEIFFGTLERPNVQLLKTVMNDPEAARFIKGVALQWAGKNAIKDIHREYPALPLFHSEQECGDGANSWAYTQYCWQLMKTYFRNGTTGYMYWNIAVSDDGRSTWGWKQNSLVTVDSATNTYRFNHDYYLLKHLTHFVDVGAKFLETTGTCDNTIGFVNPDGSKVFLLRNELSHPVMVAVKVQKDEASIKLPPDSISTLVVERQIAK